MSAFDRYLQGIIDRAGAETARDGSSTVEAHHLLLAIAGAPDGPARQVLHGAGLGRDVLEEALEREYVASLHVVGLSPGEFRLPPATPSPTVPRRLGTSTTAVIQRLAAQFRKSELGPLHLLLGIVQAEVGTVPRALDLAGVDRAALLLDLHNAIAAGGRPRHDDTIPETQERHAAPAE